MLKAQAGQSNQTAEWGGNWRDVAIVLAACIAVGMKVWLAWPAKFPELDRAVESACSIAIASASGQPTSVIATPIGLPALLLAGYGFPWPSAPIDCGVIKAKAAQLVPLVALAAVFAAVSLPFVCAAILRILTGNWTAGLLPAWLVVVFEKFSSAVGYGELEAVLSAGLMAWATLVLVAASRSKSIVLAAISGALFVSSAAMREQINLLVPGIMMAVLVLLGFARRAERRAAFASALGLGAGFALACYPLTALNQSFASTPVIVTNDQAAISAQRLGMASLSPMDARRESVWPTPPAFNAEIGKSAELRKQILSSTDRFAAIARLTLQTFADRPLQFIYETLALAAQTFWRQGYFFFLVALFYLPASWRIASARGQLAIWLAAIGPPAILALVNSVFATGHWIISLGAIILVVVIPGRIWRGM